MNLYDSCDILELLFLVVLLKYSFYGWCEYMFLKIYNYFVRGVVLFFLIIIPFTVVTNPEMIEDEVDFYFFVTTYIVILLSYVVWNYIYNYLRRKRG